MPRCAAGTGRLGRSGKVRLLAVTNKQRAPIVPQVPTVTEAGYSEFTFDGSLGFFGNRDMPTALRDRIARDIHEIASEPAVANRLVPMAQIARGSTSIEFAAAIEEQRAKMASIVKLVGKPAQ